MGKGNIFIKKFFLPYLVFLCLAIIALIACSQKDGKIKGILQSSTLGGIEVPLAGWETFDYNGTDTCLLNQSNSLTPLALKKGISQAGSPSRRVPSMKESKKYMKLKNVSISDGLNKTIDWYRQKDF